MLFRTRDLLLRRQLLYPAELLALFMVYNCVLRIIGKDSVFISETTTDFIKIMLAAGAFGYWLLAVSFWLLAVGCWLLASGTWRILNAEL